MANLVWLRGSTCTTSAVLALALACSSANGFAEQQEVYTGIDSRFSDNIGKNAGDEQDDIENRFFLRGNYRTDPGRCVGSVDGEVAYSIYSESTYDPETLINASLLGSCEIAIGLSWDIENQTRELTRSDRGNDTPNNRTRKNVFQTGPKYLWRLSPTDSLQLSAIFQKTEFSDPADNDSERAIGSVAWNHLFSSDLSAGMSSSISQVELDNTAEIHTRSLSTTFSKRWATTVASGSVGISDIETEFNSMSRSSDGFIGDLSLIRTLDSKAYIYMKASRELTDQTSDYDIRVSDFSFTLTDSTILEVTSLEAGLKKILSNGDFFSISAYSNRSDSLESLEREDQSGLNARYTRKITPLFSGVVGVGYQYLRFESNQSDDEITRIDAGLSYRATRDAELTAKIGRNERASDIGSQEFVENWLLLGFEYRLR